MKLSFRNMIFIFLGIIVVVVFIIVWTVMLPNHKASLIKERLEKIQQLQKYATENLNRVIITWYDVTKFITEQISERPMEGETVLQLIMTLHPEIVQIKVHSSNEQNDELISQNTAYFPIKMQVRDDEWIESQIDTLLRTAWINDAQLQKQYFVMQTQFKAQSIPFILTVIYDAKQLNTALSEIPIEKYCSISLHSESAMLAQNQSSFRISELHDKNHQITTAKKIRQGKADWYIVKSAFNSIKLWLIFAIPEDMN